jgi:cytochrome c-type biogenesis protein CcmH/NrfG
MSVRITRHAAVRAVPVVALLLLSAAAWSRETVSPSAAATYSRDSERCRSHANLDACYDAIRWKPRDPALLVALGDALERANRPAEAVRAYRRAAALAPNSHAVAAKISSIEAKQLSKRAPGGQRASNAEPVTKSH